MPCNHRTASSTLGHDLITGNRDRRTMMGQQSLADRSTDPSAKGAFSIAEAALTRDITGGDTGFEPVTSSVSGQNLCLGIQASMHLEHVEGG